MVRNLFIKVASPMPPLCRGSHLFHDATGHARRHQPKMTLTLVAFWVPLWPRLLSRLPPIVNFSPQRLPVFFPHISRNTFPLFGPDLRHMILHQLWSFYSSLGARSPVAPQPPLITGPLPFPCQTFFSSASGYGLYPCASLSPPAHSLYGGLGLT